MVHKCSYGDEDVYFLYFNLTFVEVLPEYMNDLRFFERSWWYILRLFETFYLTNNEFWNKGNDPSWFFRNIFCAGLQLWMKGFLGKWDWCGFNDCVKCANLIWRGSRDLHLATKNLMKNKTLKRICYLHFHAASMIKWKIWENEFNSCELFRRWILIMNNCFG